MHTFRAEGAAFVARLEAPERAVLLEVVDDVLELLATGDGDGAPGASPTAPGSGRADPLDVVRMTTGPLPVPSDPALRRLLPDASADAAVAEEFRRLTEADLRSTKSEQLLRLRAGIDAARPDLVVVPSEAARVAAALTDVRLVTSERLGVRTDEDTDALYRLVLDDDATGQGAHGTSASAPAEEARRLLATVHVMLSLLQESLVELLLAAMDQDGPVGDRG